MGGGSKRKKSDSPIIRTPKKVRIGKGAGSSGGNTESNSDKAAKMCISSFEVALSTNLTLKTGQRLTLEKGGAETYEVKFLGQKVGEVGKSTSKMISDCKELGVSYLGEVFKKEDKLNGRFIRK